MHARQEQEAVRFEALRTIANIIRFGQYIPMETAFIPLMVKMAEAEHPTLVADAIVTLVRMSVDTTLRQPIADAGTLQTCVDVVMGTTRTHEDGIVCNASSLMAGLLADPTMHTPEVCSAAKVALQSLQSRASPQIVAHVSTILASLSIAAREEGK